MSWNYRVLKREAGEESYFEVCEVYYDENMKPISYVERNPLCQENLSDLKWVHGEVLKAFNKPIIFVTENEMIESDLTHEELEK